MKPEEIYTLSDAMQWAGANTPEPVRRWWGLKCPRCGHRTWNCLGAEHFGYRAHYLGHLLDDLKQEIREEQAAEEPDDGERPLHAYELSAEDAALMRKLAGVRFGPGATIILPSGRKVGGNEMRLWTEKG